MKCNKCIYAKWRRTEKGHLHPSGDGICIYEYKMPPLPQSRYWVSESHPCGGYITRNKEFKSDCPYYRETPELSFDDLVDLIRGQHMSTHLCFVDEGPEQYQVRFTLGNQGFRLAPVEDRETAEWFKTMLAKALALYLKRGKP